MIVKLTNEVVHKVRLTTKNVELQIFIDGVRLSYLIVVTKQELLFEVLPVYISNKTSNPQNIYFAKQHNVQRLIQKYTSHKKSSFDA